MADKHIDEISGVETTGHEWDGLRELNNPLPKWWVWVFWATIIWSVGYYVVYPSWPWFGGPTAGILDWSSRGEVREELSEARAGQQAFWDRIANTELPAILEDTELLQFAMAGGRAAFGDNCAPCHGSGATGAKGYPNLNDDVWIWGGTLDDIYTSIRVGIRSGHDEERNNEMPAFGRDGLLTRQQIVDVSGYVRSLSGLDAEGADVAKGEAIFAEQCAACHGEDGKGNIELGSPDLTDRIWLYGGAMQDIVESVTNSRRGVMPAWEGRLEPATIKALTVYVHRLGGGR